MPCVSYCFNWLCVQGLGDLESQSAPQVVQALSGMDVCLVACGGDYTIALTGSTVVLLNGLVRCCLLILVLWWCGDRPFHCHSAGLFL